ncbi:GNAT family N-acetyltransferase [Bdellovibrio bacteriovorus]|uniref:GNAT family N-acetyltransferase n=1 Tax=Bdellovibrio bacteriovorus TaxID=959 RepID=UPI0021D17083|nr:GNAT family N-acetyltransferase [Bdellovibrio bacteriovorus]UXR64775.1 GNAT family N-acetyltransferase [Bdellovibrio bacteriovorus]
MSTVDITIPTLQTERLILRAFSLNDAKEIQRQAGSPKIAATTLAIPHPYPDGAAEDWISHHQENFKNGHGADWAITLKSTNELIGCISLMSSKNHHRAEVGYWVGEAHWSKGYCTEATKAAILYGFESLGLNKITACHMAHNPASGKVMVKAGMEKEGYLKQQILKNNEYVDLVVYGLIKANWLKQNTV